jgi:hypothetical protein
MERPCSTPPEALSLAIFRLFVTLFFSFICNHRACNFIHTQYTALRSTWNTPTAIRGLLRKSRMLV